MGFCYRDAAELENVIKKRECWDIKRRKNTQDGKKRILQQAQEATQARLSSFKFLESFGYSLTPVVQTTMMTSRKLAC